MDFLRQFPPEVIGLFIGLPIIILILLIGIIVTLRAQRTRAAKADHHQKTVRQPSQATSAELLDDEVGSADEASMPLPTDDDLLDAMPDLDLLAALEDAAPDPISRYHQVTDDVLQVQLQSGETEAIEVLTVLRDERDGRLMIQMDETAYRSLADVPDAKKAFTRIMKELSGVITKPDTLTEPSSRVSETVSASEPPAESATAQPKTRPDEAVPTLGSMLSQTPPQSEPEAGLLSSLEQPDEPSEAQPTSRTTSTQQAVGGSLPGDLPSYRFDDIKTEIKGKRLGFGRVEAELPPIMDIPSAIEAYLQYKLEQPSPYQGRNFHVKSSPSGGVQIEIDNQMFEAVDDIADPDIRAYIRQTIDEWSARNM